MKYYFLPYHIVKDKIKSVIENNKKDFKKNYGDVDVDYDHFETLSALGMAYVSIAVDNDLAGFSGFIINNNATHKGAEAENVVMYFLPEYRGKYFKELLDFSKKEFQRIGVPKISATIKSESLAKVLKRNDFCKAYEIWELDCE